jgi:hypothetical protein
MQEKGPRASRSSPRLGCPYHPRLMEEPKPLSTARPRGLADAFLTGCVIVFGNKPMSARKISACPQPARSWDQ